MPLVHDADGEMHQAYDAELASVYLIRPDGYLAFRAGWADHQVLLEFLETYLIRSSPDAAAPDQVAKREFRMTSQNLGRT